MRTTIECNQGGIDTRQADNGSGLILTVYNMDFYMFARSLLPHTQVVPLLRYLRDLHPEAWDEVIATERD